MSRYNMTARDAYTFAKNRRPEVSPNSSFMRILEEYEQELRQANGYRSPISKNNLVLNNKHQQYTSNNEFFRPQESGNYNLPDNSLQYNNQKNLESYFYNNPRSNSQTQMPASQIQQQHQYPSTQGFGVPNSRTSSSNLSLFGFPTNENYSNTFDLFNNQSPNNFGAYNLNRSNLNNRYSSTPSLNVNGAVGGGGYDNFQYF